MRMKTIGLIVTLLIAPVPLLAKNRREPETEVRDVITRFEAALEKHDLQAIEVLVSTDIVVFENGHRNDGWRDFRDRHLLPEFKISRTPYKTEIVRIEATPALAWGYSRMNRTYRTRIDDVPDVWAMYVLRNNGTTWKIAVLDWSVRRIE